MNLQNNTLLSLKKTPNSWKEAVFTESKKWGYLYDYR